MRGRVRRGDRACVTFSPSGAEHRSAREEGCAEFFAFRTGSPAVSAFARQRQRADAAHRYKPRPWSHEQGYSLQV